MKISERKIDIYAVAVSILIVFGFFFWLINPEEIPTQSQLATHVPESFSQMPLPAAFSQECTSLNDLPDHNCTPGAINSDITQANIKQTICNKNWSTSSIRPPTSYTNKLKAQQLVAYNFVGSLKDFEEDHLISLELGGSPKDPKNLWPEPYISPNGNGAKQKDTVENLLHKEVCNGQITLKQAQLEISTNWVKYIPTTLGASVAESPDPDDN